MDIDSFLRDPLSRRRFLQASGAGFAGSSAVSLLACGDDKAGAGAGAEQDKADVQVLNSALDLEFMAIAAYKEVAALLKGHVLQVVKDFLEQEQEHADALTSAIRDADGEPNKAKKAYDFPRPRSQRGALKFTIELEQTSVAAYIDTLPRLTKGDLRATAAAILTNEAEHISVLRDALGLVPVPNAFVTGKAR